jgi:hypothetical protein
MEKMKQKIEELEEAYNKNSIFVRNNINVLGIIEDFKYIISECERLNNLNKLLLEENIKLKKRTKEVKK